MFEPLKFDCNDIFPTSVLKHMMWILIRKTCDVLLMSIYNIYFCGEIRKNIFSLIPSYLELLHCLICEMRNLLVINLYTLLADSADNKLMKLFSYFSQTTGFDITGKLSPILCY